MSGKEILRFVAICVGVGLLLLFVLSINFWLKSRQYYQQAEAALKANELAEAISLYNLSIRSYCLFNPWVKKSRERLFKLAQDYEGKGDLPEATEVYQVLLSALASIETGYSGRGQFITKLEQKVVELRAIEAKAEAKSKE